MPPCSCTSASFLTVPRVRRPLWSTVQSGTGSFRERFLRIGVAGTMSCEAIFVCRERDAEDPELTSRALRGDVLLFGTVVCSTESVRTLMSAGGLVFLFRGLRRSAGRADTTRSLSFLISGSASLFCGRWLMPFFAACSGVRLFPSSPNSKAFVDSFFFFPKLCPPLMLWGQLSAAFCAPRSGVRRCLVVRNSTVLVDSCDRRYGMATGFRSLASAITWLWSLDDCFFCRFVMRPTSFELPAGLFSGECSPSNSKVRCTFFFRIRRSLS